MLHEGSHAEESHGTCVLAALFQLAHAKPVKSTHEYGRASGRMSALTPSAQTAACEASCKRMLWSRGSVNEQQVLPTGGPYSGAALNPARVLGPSMVFHCYWDTVPVYVSAQLLGAFLAALLTMPLYGFGPHLSSGSQAAAAAGGGGRPGSPPACAAGRPCPCRMPCGASAQLRPGRAAGALGAV